MDEWRTGYTPPATPPLGRRPPSAGGQVVVQAAGAATRAGRTEIVVTGPVHQRSKAALDADIRARRRTALVVNVRSRRGRRHFATVHRRLQATVEPTRCG